MSSRLTTSRITKGRTGAPDGETYVTKGDIESDEPTPSSTPDLSGEKGVCEIESDTGTFFSLAKKGSWQFLEGQSLSTKGQVAEEFVIKNPDCKPGVIQTKQAPLTKGYGDAQLAEPDDIEVYVEGSERYISYVEPTLGLIFLAQPVEAGSDVEVRYHYTPNPTVDAEFNNPGNTFNQYGSSDLDTKFPMNSVFPGEDDIEQPIQKGHTYTAFEEAYTGVLNDPTSLLFNEPSHSSRLPPLERSVQTSTVFFEGDRIPSGDWNVEGQGSTSFRESLFVTKDNTSSNDVVQGDPFFYRHDMDSTFPHVTTINCRMKVFDYDKKDDFTGIAVGYASEDRLYFLGFLDVGGTTFAGFLTSNGDETDWQSYKGLSAEISSRTVNGVDRNDRLVFDRPPSFGEDDEVFIDGRTFEVDQVNTLSGGSQYEVLLKSEMTSSGVVEVFPELDMSTLTSYRIFKNEQGVVKAFVGGKTTPLAVIEDFDVPSQEEVFELLETNELFFGSISRQTKSEVGWDFVRYSIIPNLPEERAPRIYVEGDFHDRPDENPNEPWTLLDDQGYSTDLENEYLLVEHAGRPEQGSYSYGRIEPLLTPHNRVELRTRMRVDAFATGSPATITVADKEREVTLGLFADKASTSTSDYSTYKVSSGQTPQPQSQTVSSKGTLSQVNDDGEEFHFHEVYSGTQSFSNEGWTDDLPDTTTSTFIDHFHNIQKPSGYLGDVTQEVSFPTGNIFDNHTFSCRLRLNNWEKAGSGRLSIQFGLDDALDEIFLGFMKDGSTDKVVMLDRQGDILTDSLGDPLGFEYEWSDHEFHTYKVTRSGDTVSVFVDGVFQDSFMASQLDDSSRRQSAELSISTWSESVDVDVDYFFGHSTEYGTRKIGLWTGGDLHDPESYELIDKEWLGTFIDIEIIRDPQGQTQVFIDGEEIPSFSRQYNELPNRSDRKEVNTSLGYVQFGALDSRSLSESVWDFMRYSIHNVRESQRTLEHSVFNAVEPDTSPEPVKDENPEEMVLMSNTESEIFLSPKGLTARRVLAVKSEDGSKSYDFEFNEDTNEIHILRETLPERRTPLFVRFISKEPYSRSYIDEQDPVNRLNEGTPPFEASQEKFIESIEEFVSQFNDLDDTFNEDIDFTLSDDRMRISYKTNDEAFYHSLDMNEENLGGEQDLLHAACDELGWTGIEFSEYTDTYEFPDQLPHDFGTIKQRFVLDDFNSRLDSMSHVISRTSTESTSKVRGGIKDIRKEAYGGAEDEALTGSSKAVLTEIKGFLLDNQAANLDDTSDRLDEYSESDTLIDYSSTVNYP